MSELLLDELCRRLRYMVEVRGHLMDLAHDRTRDIGRAHAKRWIWGNLHVIVDFNRSRMSLTDWGRNVVLIAQERDGTVITYPNKEFAKDLVIGLRAEMILEELADA